MQRINSGYWRLYSAAANTKDSLQKREKSISQYPEEFFFFFFTVLKKFFTQTATNQLELQGLIFVYRSWESVQSNGREKTIGGISEMGEKRGKEGGCNGGRERLRKREEGRSMFCM